MSSSLDNTRRRSALNIVERQKHTSGSSATTATDTRLNPRTRTEIIGNKIHALIWIAAAVGICYCLDILNIILENEAISRPHLYLAAICLGVNSVLTFYLCWIACVPWDVYCPKVIPAMTGVGLLCAFLMIRAFWPVWGFLTPIILGIVTMGGIFSFHFIPF